VKSAVESLTPTRAKLTVEVPFEELKPSLDAAYKKIAQQINVPGFRRGKVPAVVIDRHLGRGAALDEAINEALPRLYREALEANELTPLAQPEIDITKLEDGELLEFTAEVDVRPEIDLPPYDGLEVSVDDVTVTDRDVEEELQTLRERFAVLKDVDRPAAEGDRVVISLKATREGETVEGGELNDYTYRVGDAMITGLDEAVVGRSAGDSASFASQLAGGDQQGEDVEVELTLSAVKEQELPELDDDFAQLASEFDTVAELTDDLRKRLENTKRLEQAAAARDAVLEKVLGLTEVPLPQGVVSDELAARRDNLEQQLQYAGMTLQQYLDTEQQTADEFEADLEKRVRDAVASQFILDEVAKKEQIGVDQNELTEEMVRRAQMSGENPNDFMRHMLDHNHIPEIVSDVLRGKALAAVVQSAKVTDASGNSVELANLRPDGTVGELEEAPEDRPQDRPEDGPEGAPGTAAEDSGSAEAAPASDEDAHSQG
jgi:trigger factor